MCNSPMSLVWLELEVMKGRSGVALTQFSSSSSSSNSLRLLLALPVHAAECCDTSNTPQYAALAAKSLQPRPSHSNRKRRLQGYSANQPQEAAAGATTAHTIHTRTCRVRTLLTFALASPTCPPPPRPNADTGIPTSKTQESLHCPGLAAKSFINLCTPTFFPP